MPQIRQYHGYIVELIGIYALDYFEDVLQRLIRLPPLTLTHQIYQIIYLQLLHALPEAIVRHEEEPVLGADFHYLEGGLRLNPNLVRYQVPNRPSHR